ncbi:MAG: D-alanine--D-alanine ligase, partial [Ignavibacteria bacterium]|nr:D-alanine--D-alanine ligase [Ignavibacteria bacterium]
MVEANNDAFTKLKELKPDIVFNFAEGLTGVNRESHLPAMLEMLQIPYSGSDALTLGICLDKSRAKEILTYHKIPNAKFLVANQKDDIKNANFDFPLIVKPISEGSSKGIFSSSFVKNTKELEDEINRILISYNQPALIEEFLSGREFTVAVLGNGDETE